MDRPGRPLILVADNDANVLNATRCELEEFGYRVVCAADTQQLWEQLSVEEPALVLLDLQVGDKDGVPILRELLRRRPQLCVVIVAAQASIEAAVSAIKLGACDYLSKPADPTRLNALIQRAMEKRKSPQRLDRLEELMAEQDDVQPIFGQSPAMNRVRDLIDGIAATNATVLILGESGTGKELVARLLHEQSRHRQGPYVPVNMAALPRELAESTLFGHEKGAFTGADKARTGCCAAAHEGTLFLDEIGEMEPSVQAKLLRFLQDRLVQPVGSHKSIKVDVRVVAATNRDLQGDVREGRFREDLYYRLHVLPIFVPPLREHREDIPLLARHFLQRAAARHHKNLADFTDAALQALVDCEWPGNVRQLENVVERVAILCHGPDIELADLSPEVLQPPMAVRHPDGSLYAAGAAEGRLREADLRPMHLMERQAILSALQNVHGSVHKAAKLLGLGQATVYRKIKRYGIRLKVERRPPIAES